MSDVLTTTMMKLVNHKTALENAQETEKDRRKRLVYWLEQLKVHVDEALDSEGELDPGAVLVLAEKLDAADREYGDAINTRAAREREVALLEDLLREAKGDAA